MTTDPTCGRCGVYRHLHPTKRCETPRLSFWWDRHSAARHIAAWVWIHATPSRARWAFAHWMNRNPERRDWCQLVDCLVYADQWNMWKDDYSDLCDFPLPTDAAAPRYGWCYCTPTEVAA